MLGIAFGESCIMELLLIVFILQVWFRTLPQSMSGVEFIDWLISRKEASSYGEAVHIGQLLLNAGAIQCFNKDCGFLEKDQYYHFNLSVESHEVSLD